MKIFLNFTHHHKMQPGQKLLEISQISLKISTHQMSGYQGSDADLSTSWFGGDIAFPIGKADRGLPKARLHYISPSNLSLLLLLLSLQLRDLCPYTSMQGLIRPSPPCSRRVQSDQYFLNKVRPRANLCLIG